MKALFAGKDHSTDLEFEVSSLEEKKLIRNYGAINQAYVKSAFGLVTLPRYKFYSIGLLTFRIELYIELE